MEGASRHRGAKLQCVRMLDLHAVLLPVHLCYGCPAGAGGPAHPSCSSAAAACTRTLTRAAPAWQVSRDGKGNGMVLRMREQMPI